MNWFPTSLLSDRVVTLHLPSPTVLPRQLSPLMEDAIRATLPKHLLQTLVLQDTLEVEEEKEGKNRQITQGNNRTIFLHRHLECIFVFLKAPRSPAGMGSV